MASNLDTIKFVDEAHFVHKDCSRNLAIGPKGITPVLLRGSHFAETYSVTCMVSLNQGDRPCYISTRTNTNDQIDFFQYLVAAVNDKYLKRGDILICDNASIHCAEGSLELIVAYLNAAGVALRFLPSYSPELNPCELVFSQVKSYLRRHRDQSLSLKDDIALAFAIVSKANMKAYYQKCCRKFN